jgi:TolB-like protein
MAVVWLARDLKHDRAVAIKMLRPELAAAIGAERFRREIKLTAGLQHPNILPLHDSGDAAGLLYYVMPFVEGESLRERLAREGALPVADALRLAAEIGAALGHAHRHGIVHRDVKPENVLLADGRALVADLGIARAGGGSARLTEAGMSLGTPAYMSPEQGAGDAVDERTDQYALAVVTYEMLAGEPPFTGPTAQSLMAKHVAQPAPSIRTTRPAVPEHVDAALRRALAKAPADRFGSIADFVDALEHAPAQGGPRGSTPWRSSSRRTAVVIGVLGTIVAGLVVMRWLAARHADAAPIDPNALAVMPFRVDGADPSLHYLGDGMVDLVAVKLPGGGGLRAVAPRATIAAWRSLSKGTDEDPAVAVARRLGAGLVLDGSVVGTPSRVTLNAALRDVTQGISLGAGEVSGPADSLAALVDRLVVEVLASRSGVTMQQLAGMSSVPAFREYLAGVAAHRAARYAEAIRHFDGALQEDSTFALAALAAVPSSWRLGDVPIGAYAERAFRMRGRLHGADSIMLRALLGDTMPDDRTILGTIADLEQAVAAMPDRAEAWFELGDRQLHFGALNDYPDAVPRAKRSLQRALALDSSYAIAVDHLLMIALHDRDSAAAAGLAPLYRRTGNRGDRSGAFDWMLAKVLGDTAALRQIATRIPSMPRASLEWLSVMPLLEAGASDVGVMAVAQLVRDASTVGEVRAATNRARVVMLNAGHPQEAEAATRRWVEAGGPPILADFARVVAARYWDGDSAAGEAGLRHLAAAPSQADDPARDARGWHACALGLGGMAAADSRAVADAAARFRRLLDGAPSHETQDDNRRLCAAVLDAALAVAARRDDARVLLARADSIYIHSIAGIYWYYGIAMSRLHAAIGDEVEALRLLRRRTVAVESPNDIALLSSVMREEGRLAAVTEDTSGAVRAYRHYLALRADPDPELVPQRDSVRAALDTLMAEPQSNLSAQR